MRPRKVSAYRKSISLNQKEVADYLGVSVDAYSKKERGISEFRESEIAKFIELVNNKGLKATANEIFFN